MSSKRSQKAKGHMHKSFGAIVGCSIAAVSPFSALIAQNVTLPPATAFRVQLDHRVRSHVGATVAGHLTEPVYLVDHEVIPAGSLISGSIRGTHPGSKSIRIRRLLAADFTPPRLPDVVFDSITLPAIGNQGGRVIAIEASAVQTDANVLTLGTKKQKQSIKSQIGSYIKQRKEEASEGLKQHKVGEIIEKWAVGQLPYHPEILWSDTRFNADLAMAATIPDTSHPVLVTEDLRGRLPEGTLHARLVSPLTSETAKKGDQVDAIITRPLLSPEGARLLVPEGTHLHGVVVQTKAARRWGHNGDLRFAFRNLDLPTADGSSHPTEIHGRLSAAETSGGQHVSIDEEGQAKASDGPAKFAEPALLGVLALAGGPDDEHPGTAVPGAAGFSSNGFGLVARVISLSTRNTSVIQGFAYYSLAKSVYFHFIAKGHDTTFPHDTEIEVTLSER
jgi:hypothetical protein